jgi:hypothetical protein
VRAGLSLVLLVAERVEAIVAKRRASPLSTRELDRERDDVANLRQLRDRVWSRMPLHQLLFIIVMMGGALALLVFGVLRGC